jgi:anti-sigma regulatory factor (Ser/Thr protein kinase)/CBS domain-containing protein
MSETQRFKGKFITDKQAESITRVEELAYELRVDEVMTHNPVVVSEDMFMSDVLEVFRSKRISGAPVMKDGTILGVISLEDLIKCLKKADLKANVTKYMTPRLISVKNTDPVIEGLKLFVSTQVGRLIVVNHENKLAGILTKGDVTSGLLKALQKDYHAEELRRYRASHLFEDIESDRTSLILRYSIAPRDFMHGGEASSNIKRALVRMGANPQLSRRVGIAVYEAEMNLIIHADHGGDIRVEIEPHQISIRANDDGPGIADVALAMKPGYSTATQEIRELGFGAGMGLVNIHRCVDEMKLESEKGKGTRLTMKLFLTNQEGVGEGYPLPKESEKDESATNN